MKFYIKMSPSLISPKTVRAETCWKEFTHSLPYLISKLLTVKEYFLFNFQLENGVAEISFNSKKEVSDLGFQSLEELDGSYLYIAASVMESTGKLLSSDFFKHICKCTQNKKKLYS